MSEQQGPTPAESQIGTPTPVKPDATPTTETAINAAKIFRNPDESEESIEVSMESATDVSFPLEEGNPNTPTIRMKQIGNELHMSVTDENDTKDLVVQHSTTVALDGKNVTITPEQAGPSAQTIVFKIKNA